MKFVLAIQFDSHHKIGHFRCADLDRKQNLTEPYLISRAQMLKLLEEGGDVRLLVQKGCRWDVESHAKDLLDASNEKEAVLKSGIAILSREKFVVAEK